MKPDRWRSSLSTSTLVLIPAAVGINYVGKLFAGLLKLPLWLDSIGTVLAAILAGPVAGGNAAKIGNCHECSPGILGTNREAYSYTAASLVGEGILPICDDDICLFRGIGFPCATQ